MDTSIPQKHCSRCKQDKPATPEYFYKSRNCPGGLYPTCTECVKKAYREKHPPQEIVIIPEGYKRCSTCKETLPCTTEYFQRNKAQKGGFNNECKTCKNKRARVYDQRPDVREKRIPRQKAWNDSHKDFHREYYKVYNEANREKNGVRSKAYYQRHKQHHSEMGKIRYRKNREAIRIARLRYRQANREHVRELRRRSYQKNKEHRQAWERAYRQTERGRAVIHAALAKYQHSEKGQLHRHEYYQANKARIDARVSAWKQTEQGKISTRASILRYRQTDHGKLMDRINHQRRRARLKNIPGTHTHTEIQEQFKRQKGRCYYAACGFSKFKKVNGRYVFHVEHLVPVSRIEANPRNDMSNIVLACPTCNIQKNDRLPHEWPAGGRLL